MSTSAAGESGRERALAPRRTWWRVALLVGAASFIVGKAFALPPDHLRAWRVAAWLACGVAYGAPVVYELSRLQNSPRTAALHVACAVALGALAFAVAGMIHAAPSGTALRPAWFLALVAWPAVTAIPAFLGALAAGAVVTRYSKRAGSP